MKGMVIHLRFDRLQQILMGIHFFRKVKKCTGVATCAQKLIYLLKGGQLVINSVPNYCCIRVTGALRSNDFSLTFFTIGSYQLLQVNFPHS